MFNASIEAEDSIDNRGTNMSGANPLDIAVEPVPASQKATLCYGTASIRFHLASSTSAPAATTVPSDFSPAV